MHTSNVPQDAQPPCDEILAALPLATLSCELVATGLRPCTSPWTNSRGRRCLDFLLASLALTILLPLLLLVGALVWLTSPGPMLFRQRRVGRYGRPFNLFKFRTMVHGGAKAGLQLTRDGDPRVTRLGRGLRRLKLDELPQLYNVLRGDMSLVGPRPKLARYAGIPGLPCRPGVTGAATLAFVFEEDVLREVPAAMIEDFYEHYIKPAKAHLDCEYMAGATLLTDLRLLWRTAAACVGRDRKNRPAWMPGLDDTPSAD